MWHSRKLSALTALPTALDESGDTLKQINVFVVWIGEFLQVNNVNIQQRPRQRLRLPCTHPVSQPLPSQAFLLPLYRECLIPPRCMNLDA
jgi:hypothetical protein